MALGVTFANEFMKSIVRRFQIKWHLTSIFLSMDIKLNKFIAGCCCCCYYYDYCCKSNFQQVLMPKKTNTHERDSWARIWFNLVSHILTFVFESCSAGRFGTVWWWSSRVPLIGLVFVEFKFTSIKTITNLCSRSQAGHWQADKASEQSDSGSNDWNAKRNTTQRNTTQHNTTQHNRPHQQRVDRASVSPNR